jgi:hypothetical protein
VILLMSQENRYDSYVPPFIQTSERYLAKVTEP